MTFLHEEYLKIVYWFIRLPHLLLEFKYPLLFLTLIYGDLCNVLVFKTIPKASISTQIKLQNVLHKDKNEKHVSE